MNREGREVTLFLHPDSLLQGLKFIVPQVLGRKMAPGTRRWGCWFYKQ